MRVVGLMSGTSADGVDAAVCEISGHPGALSARIICGETFAYESLLRQRILDSCDPEKSRVDDIAQLHVDLAEVFSASTLQLIQAHDISRESIDLIGSHGHTLWHNVLPKRPG